MSSGITNNASYCVYIAPGATRVIGDLGCTDPNGGHRQDERAGRGRAGNDAQPRGRGRPSRSAGSDIFALKNKAWAKVVWKVTDGGGSVVNSSIEGVSVTGVPGATEGARFVGGTKSGAPTSGTWMAKHDFAIDQTGTIWIYNGAKWVAAAARACPNGRPGGDDAWRPHGPRAAAGPLTQGHRTGG